MRNQLVYFYNISEICPFISSPIARTRIGALIKSQNSELFTDFSVFTPPSSPSLRVLHFSFVYSQPSAPVITSRGRLGTPGILPAPQMGRLLPSPAPAPGPHWEVRTARPREVDASSASLVWFPSSQGVAAGHKVSTGPWPRPPCPWSFGQGPRQQPSPLFLRLGLVTVTHLRLVAGQGGDLDSLSWGLTGGQQSQVQKLPQPTSAHDGSERWTPPRPCPGRGN